MTLKNINNKFLLGISWLTSALSRNLHFLFFYFFWKVIEENKKKSNGILRKCCDNAEFWYFVLGKKNSSQTCMCHLAGYQKEHRKWHPHRKGHRKGHRKEHRKGLRKGHRKNINKHHRRRHCSIYRTQAIWLQNEPCNSFFLFFLLLPCYVL